MVIATECTLAVEPLFGTAKGVRGNLPPLRRPVLCHNWAQCVSRARVRRSLRPVRESPATPFLTEGALVHHDVVSPGAR